MREETCAKIRRFYGLASICFLLIPCSRLGAASPELLREHIFLIDTSSSMTSNKLLAPLRVAIDDYADTIPIDGTSRVWIFTFDNGLKKFSQRMIGRARDMEDVKIFLASIEARGGSTLIFRSLDGVLAKVEEAMADGKPHDFVIHLFTDGEDTGSRPYSFDKNISRFVELREANDGRMELHYHTLTDDVRISQSMSNLIRNTTGVYLIPGALMPPKADFTLPQVTLYDNAPVTFINRTVGKVDTWQWTFEDGATSKEKDPTHVFLKPGKYSVQLEATNAQLYAKNPVGKNTATRQIEVKGGPPVANFEIENPDELYAGKVIRFRDTSAGQIKSRSWDFGDGQGRSSDINPAYAYKQPGVHKVTLKLTGVYGEGPSSECTKTVNVLQALRLDFSCFPDSPRLGEELQFNNRSLGAYERWSWDFGDGAKSNEHSPRHTYRKDGKYEVTLTGVTVGGSSDKIAKTVLVRPRARFVLSRKSVVVGEPVEMKDQSSGQITRWRWDVGDEPRTVLETRDVNYSYKTAGTYTIKLEVTGPAGADSAEDRIGVEPCRLSFSVTPEEPNDRETARFAFESESVGVFERPEWDFGDGNTSSEKAPQHAYQSPGTYVVRLSAVGPDGKSQSASKEIRVKPVPPKADFELGIPTLQVGQELELSAALCSGTIHTYIWDMNDGNSYSEPNPKHKYQKAGTFTIKLTVSNDYDQSDSCEKTITVEVPGPPELSFQLAPGYKEKGRAPLAVKIQNNSTGPIVRHHWDFGDGSTSDDRNPEHTYTGRGKYKITYFVVDQEGRQLKCTSSQAISITVLTDWRVWPFLAAVAACFWYVAVAKFRLGRRCFTYSVDGSSESHTFWKDKTFGDDRNGFDVRLRRSLLLSKKYCFENSHGNVQGQTNFGEQLVDGSRLEQGNQITIDAKEIIYFEGFDDGRWSWVAAWLCIIAALTAILIASQVY